MNELNMLCASRASRKKDLIAAEVAGDTRTKEEPMTPARPRAL